jgi:hypothetical protein
MSQLNFLGKISNDINEEPSTYYVDASGVYRISIFPFCYILKNNKPQASTVIGTSIINFIERSIINTSAKGIITKLPDYHCE